MKALFTVPVLLFAAATAGAADQITISTEEFPPFTSTSLKGNGIDCEIVREALKLSGLEVRFVFVPAARSLKMAEDGETDASLPWTKRPGRETDFLFSEPVIKKDNEVFFVLKDTSFEWDPASRNYELIKGKSIGAVNAYNYGERFEAAEKNQTIHVERVREDKLNFNKLFGKRFDALIAKRMVGRLILNEYYTAEQRALVVEKNENSETEDSDYLLISRKSPKAERLLKAIDTGLQELRRSGKYSELLKQFEAGAYFEKSESKDSGAAAADESNSTQRAVPKQ